MKALLTGGSGFLAAHLCPMLVERGWQLRLLMRRADIPKYLKNIPLEIVSGDLSDLSSLQAATKGMDAVFHMAGMISYNPAKAEQMRLTNVVGTENIARAAREAGVKRFVFTSSTAAIGVNTNPQGMLNESTPFNARHLGLAYFDTKYDAEAALLKEVKLGLPAVIVNPGSLVGAYDARRYEKSYPGLIYKFNPRFTVPGGINFVDVRDAALGHILAYEKGRVGERYILGGENLTFAQLIERTNQVIGRSSPSWQLPKSCLGLAANAVGVLQKIGIDLHFTPELVKQLADWYLFVDNRKAREELGFAPRPITEAIQLTLDWLKLEQRIK